MYIAILCYSLESYEADVGTEIGMLVYSVELVYDFDFFFFSLFKSQRYHREAMRKYVCCLTLGHYRVR